jgi:hypothetical protein
MLRCDDHGALARSTSALTVWDTGCRSNVGGFCRSSRRGPHGSDALAAVRAVAPSLSAAGLAADELFTHVHGPGKAAVLRRLGAAAYVGDTPADMAAAVQSGVVSRPGHSAARICRPRAPTWCCSRWPTFRYGMRHTHK